MDFKTRKVLVLNADFRALTICSVYKAFLLVYLGKAEVINNAAKGYLRTVSKTYSMPSVIRLNKYVHVSYKNVMMTRQNIFKRDGNKCVYCSATDDLTLDHVLPKSKGGTSTWTNLVTACKKCNTKKGDFMPEEVQMDLPYKPFKPTFIMFLRDFSGVGDESWMPYLQVSTKTG